MNRNLFRASLAALAMLTFIGNGSTEEPPPPGEQPPPNFNPAAPPQGLTLGYWKNHTEKWPTSYWYAGSFRTISTDTLVSDVFPSDFYADGVGNATLLEALNFKGGPGIAGAQRILLKQAVASLLNASSTGAGTPLDINFPIEQWELIDLVTVVLDLNDRGTMLELGTLLDDYNNLEVAP